eukprot:1362386-Amorphochlora_amoeboformis.AAC.2
MAMGGHCVLGRIGQGFVKRQGQFKKGITNRAMKNAITTSHIFGLLRSFKAAPMVNTPVAELSATAMRHNAPTGSGDTIVPTTTERKIARSFQPDGSTPVGTGKARVAAAMAPMRAQDFRGLPIS